jgi:glycosyltransferase involved in cell wall biosynthesis
MGKDSSNKPIGVLYSFPHKIGADRICHTAWQQVSGLAAAGADIALYTGVLHKPVPASVEVHTTLARGKLRIPYKIIGSMRAFALHDHIVAKSLEKLAGRIDIVHTWPLGALQTLKAAKRLGITTVLERPNAHTRYAYEVVERECKMLGVSMPEGHEHAFNETILRKEEEEYALADRLLCPSDFVARTFLDQGYSKDKIARHQYGFDDKIFQLGNQNAENGRGLTMLYVGGCAPRKGLHYALEAWLDSPVHKDGTFLIAGGFIPGYAERLSGMLSHPSIKVLGHRTDVPELMRQSDLFVLSTIEEGSALVTSEARGSGCVLLVSEASGAVCSHMENALVHEVGDVKSLSAHMTMLYEDRKLLKKLRDQSVSTIGSITWSAAGKKLLEVYKNIAQEGLRL